MKDYVESSGLIDQPEALRARADADGYLYFKDRIPLKDLMAVRADFAAILYNHGWLDDGTNPIDALTTQRPRLEGDDDYWPVLDEFQRLESFHTLPHHPSILSILDVLFDETALPHPRNIGRIMFPNAVEHSTPSHQDYIHIQGTPNTWTCWIPLSDVPQELGGGLAIAAGSNKRGLLPVRQTLGAGHFGIDEERIDDDWHQGPLSAGSFLLFHSNTIHRGLPNRTANRIRLSVDYRYQPSAEPICSESLKPHFARMTWDDIYAEWESKRFQYYWKDLPLQCVAHDLGIIQRNDMESGPVPSSHSCEDPGASDPTGIAAEKST